MDSITGLRYAELQRRPTYEELIDVIVKDFKVKLPDRTATLIYNSPEIQNLLAGDGSSIKDVEEHELRKYKEEEKEIIIKRQAATSSQTAQQIRTQEKGTSMFDPPQIFDVTLDDRIDDAHEDIQDNLENHAHNKKQQHQQMVDFVKRHLYEHATPGPLDFAHEGATRSRLDRPQSRSQGSADVPYFHQAFQPQQGFASQPANAEIPTHEPSPPTNVKTMAQERQRAKSVGPNTKSPAQKQPEGMAGPVTPPVPASVPPPKGKGKGWGKSKQKEVIAEALPPSSMPKAKGAPETLGPPRPKSRGKNTKPKIAEALLPEPKSAAPEPKSAEISNAKPSKGVIKTKFTKKPKAKPKAKPRSRKTTSVEDVPMPEAETPKRETKPSKTLYVIPPLRKKRAETPVPRAKKVTAKAPPPEGPGGKAPPPEPKAPPPEPKAKAPPPAPKAKAPPPAPKAKAPPREPNLAYTALIKHEKVTGMDEEWWKKQGMGVLKEQAELRGKKFTDRETKGVPSQGIPRFKKADYLRVLLELLKKEK